MSQSLPRVWLARHGETEWTVKRLHTGRTDLPLTERGEANAVRLGERLRGVTFDCVFTSPLCRARLTSVLAGFEGRAQVLEDLVEWDYGLYEGRHTKDIHVERPDWQLFRDGCPGGESVAAVGARADRVVGALRPLTGNTLLFGHGHFFRVVAARWLGLPPCDGRLFQLDCAAVSILSYEHDDDPAIQLWNDDRHALPA
jgi:probable phosphoglycerate mutase